MGGMPNENCIRAPHGPKCSSRPVSREGPVGTVAKAEPVASLLARAGAAQPGVVARWQLLQRGVTAKEIRGCVSRGHLQPLHLGVYAVGHRVIGRWGRWHAAVLAGGPGTVLSHRSAAQALGLLWPIEIDVEI